MADAFEVGDIVRLNSGSPKMTITHIRDDSVSKERIAACSWFDGNRSHSAAFPLDTLMPDTDFTIWPA